MQTNPRAARARLEKARRAVLKANPSDLLRLNPDLHSPSDAVALTEELAAWYLRRNQDGLAPGVEGWWEDSVALLKPWGFSPETIHAPVMVWHGRQDRMVPIQHGEWLAERLPNASPHLTDQDGHLTLLTSRVPAVHAWLLEHL
jgi:pimeloyl-ACP methyl ester carboxylesterase